MRFSLDHLSARPLFYKERVHQHADDAPFRR